jgi:hypothetical protein
VEKPSPVAWLNHRIPPQDGGAFRFHPHATQPEGNTPHNVYFPAQGLQI